MPPDACLPKSNGCTASKNLTPTNCQHRQHPQRPYGVALAVRGSCNPNRLLANHGPDSLQEVPHLHVHIFGGQKVGRMIAVERQA